MSNPEEKSAQAKKKRGHVSVRLTHLGDRLSRLESKELTATDRPEITQLGTRVDELDTEFRDLHDLVI